MQNPKVDLIVGNLTEVIESGLERAATFYALVAFVRLSGIASLLSTLQKFVQAGGEAALKNVIWKCLWVPRSRMCKTISRIQAWISARTCEIINNGIV